LLSVHILSVWQASVGACIGHWLAPLIKGGVRRRKSITPLRFRR
jgi:hypothetical protein